MTTTTAMLSSKSSLYHLRIDFAAGKVPESIARQLYGAGESPSQVAVLLYSQFMLPPQQITWALITSDGLYRPATEVASILYRVLELDPETVFRCLYAFAAYGSTAEKAKAAALEILQRALIPIKQP